MKIKIISIITALICSTGAAQAATFDRGGGLIYDDVLDITWLQNANQGAGSALDDGSNTTDGRMTWDNAVAWADDLSFGGFSDWRLASMDVNGDDTIVNCTGATELVCRDNELGYMFYQNLGGNWGDNLAGNQPPFENIWTNYWSGTEFAPDQDLAWFFAFHVGSQGATSKDLSVFAWAVRPGDVSATVPLPATAMLLGLGLVGLLGMARRQR